MKNPKQGSMLSQLLFFSFFASYNFNQPHLYSMSLCNPEVMFTLLINVPPPHVPLHFSELIYWPPTISWYLETQRRVVFRLSLQITCKPTDESTVTSNCKIYHVCPQGKLVSWFWLHRHYTDWGLSDKQKRTRGVASAKAWSQEPTAHVSKKQR